MIHRRAFIRSLALALLAIPFAAGAQKGAKIPLVGVLSPATPTFLSDPKMTLYAFRQGLRELGYVEGQTIRLEYRFAEWQWDRLSTLAVELVQLNPDVIVTNTTPGALAAKRATTTIPIVIAIAEDLVEAGIVVSLARPGGNITGQNLRDLELAGKRLELLKTAVPRIALAAVLVDPADRAHDRVPGNIEEEAQALGVRLQRVEARDAPAFDAAFVAIANSGSDALMIMDSSLFSGHRHRLLELARTHRLPTVCGGRQYAEAGCLIAYSPNHLELFRRAAVFVDKILKGAKPADLPVEQPDRLQLFLNLKTAQTLGLTIPPSLLLRADEIIQ